MVTCPGVDREGPGVTPLRCRTCGECRSASTSPLKTNSRTGNNTSAPSTPSTQSILRRPLRGVPAGGGESADIRCLRAWWSVCLEIFANVPVGEKAEVEESAVEEVQVPDFGIGT